jgi:hypothetical protein
MPRFIGVSLGPRLPPGHAKAWGRNQVDTRKAHEQTRNAKREAARKGEQTTRTRFRGHYVYNLAKVVSDMSDRLDGGLGRESTLSTDDTYTKEGRTRRERTRLGSNFEVGRVAIHCTSVSQPDGAATAPLGSGWNGDNNFMAPLPQPRKPPGSSTIGRKSKEKLWQQVDLVRQEIVWRM